MTLPMFAECALAGCRNLADDPGGPCPGCVELFAGVEGWAIQRAVGSDPETAEQVAARKATTVAAQALALTPPTAERKQNQRCWLCEQRRTCTRQQHGWECDACWALPA